MALKKQLGVKTPALWIQTLTSDLTSELDVQRFLAKWEPLVDWVDVTSVATIGNQVINLGSTFKRYECDDIWTTMAVFWNGDTTVCCVDHNGKLKKGNLKEQSILEIWSTPEYSELRDAHKRGDYSNHPMCDKCLDHPTPKEQFIHILKKKSYPYRKQAKRILTPPNTRA